MISYTKYVEGNTKKYYFLRHLNSSVHNSNFAFMNMKQIPSPCQVHTQKKLEVTMAGEIKTRDILHLS